MYADEIEDKTKTMKASELRIGNWIFDSGEEQKPFQIEQICKDSDGFEGYYIVYRNGSIKSRIDSELFDPIPLTPEILEKTNINEFSFFNWANGVLRCGFAEHSMFNIKCDYLHQLQNIIHALTGEELNIQL